jgi:hypothetical protein
MREFLKKFFDPLSSIAATALLLGYFLVSTKTIGTDSLLFHILNFVGGALLIWWGVLKRAGAVIVLNIVWTVAALYFIFLYL